MTETRLARLPLATLALAAASAALLALPHVAEWLSFERARLAREPWRVLTGHWVHHRSLAAADLGVFVVLGIHWERRSRAAWLAIVLASSALASLALIALTDFARYGGSSAVGSGLFVAAALAATIEHRGLRRAAGLAALALFAAKCIVEASDPGRGLFVDLPPATRIAVEAHVAGGIGGAAVVALLAWRRREPR